MGVYGFGYLGSSPRIASLVRPNGSKASYVYDSLARLTSIANKTSADDIISSFNYAYNSADQRSTETIISGTAAVFSANSQIGYNYDAANKLISSSSPTTFSYDGDGNMTTGLTPDGFPFTAQYDAMNQLINFEYTDGSAVFRKTTYGYNGFGYLETINRFADNLLSEQIRYVRDEALVYQEQSNVNGRSDYTWGLDYAGGIGGLLGLNRDAAAYFYLYDGKGNVTGVIDSAQAVAAGYSYDPFGVLLRKSGNLEQPYRYSTKTYDEGTGLSYYGYRHYSPVLGRWITRDPSGLKLYEMNLNAFVRNNPINLIDPFGLDDSSDNLQKLADQMASRKEAIDHLNNSKKDLADLAKVPTGAAGAAGYLLKLNKLNKVCNETIETREKFEKAYEERRKEEKAKQEFKKMLWDKFRIQYSEP